MKIWSVVVIAVVIGAAGLGVRSSADEKPATAETLRQMEADFMKAAAEKGAEGYMSYLRRRRSGGAERRGRDPGQGEHREDKGIPG